MRKLLVLLSGLSSVAFANYLPNGAYTGNLTSDAKHTIDAASGNIINDSVDVTIPKLTDIGAQNGKLSGTVQSMGAGVDTDCFGGTAQFSATKIIPIHASDVKITNCQFNSLNNTFTGNYSALVPIFGKQTGTFTFTLQQ